MKKLIDTIARFLNTILSSAFSGVVEGGAEAAMGVAMLGRGAQAPPIIIMGQGAQPGTQAQAVAPAPQQASPLNAAAANALNTATSAATTLGGQVAQQASNLASQAVPAAQRLGRGIADAADDAWVPPAIVLYLFYMAYMISLIVLLPDAHHRIQWISSRAPSVTYGWYMLVFGMYILVPMGVFMSGVIAGLFPTRGDKLNFPITWSVSIIMLLTIPLAPLAMGSALGSAIHSARLAGVPERYLDVVYTTGNTLMITGIIWAFIYDAIIGAALSTSDAVADAIRGTNVPLERLREGLRKWGTLVITIITVRYGAMAYFPHPQLTEDFIDYGIMLVMIGLLLFTATEIEVKIETWQKVVIAFLFVIVGTTIWFWLRTRHPVEVQQVTTQITAQRSLLERVWDIWANDLVVNAGLLTKHGAGYGFFIGLVKGVVFSALGTFFLWATGVSWGQAKGANWRKLIFGPIFLVTLIASLGMLISDLSIVFGWLSRLR